jgi:hypothetical protein
VYGSELICVRFGPTGFVGGGGGGVDNKEEDGEEPEHAARARIKQATAQAGSSLLRAAIFAAKEFII